MNNVLRNYIRDIFEHWPRLPCPHSFTKDQGALRAPDDQWRSARGGGQARASVRHSSHRLSVRRPGDAYHWECVMTSTSLITRSHVLLSRTLRTSRPIRLRISG
jgi:hypothetical protein